MSKPAKAPAQAAGESKLDRYRLRIAGIRNARSSWEAHWRDIQHFISPRSGRFWLGDTNVGIKKAQRIINNAPTQASKTLAAGMMSGLTSPSRPWFRLMTPDPNMMEVGSVKLWLFAVESRLRDVLARSNLYQCLPNLYRELGDYGTSLMLCEGDDAFVCRFMPLTIGSYWLATNDKREVDTVYREVEMTVRQTVNKFGYAQCSPNVRSQFDAQHFENRIIVEHLIQPNNERDPQRVDAKNKPWASCYWERGQAQFLRESGYTNKPFFAPRWDVLGDDIYGSSPGMDALGDAKMLQVREKQFAMAIDKHVDPPLVGGPDLRSSGVNALPGTVTFANPQAGGFGLGPIYQTAPDYQGALQDKQDIINRIRDVYYANLFLMLDQQPQTGMTATEVNERVQEKMLALGPVLERLNNELLDPLIDRVFGLMVDASAPYWDGRLNGAPLLPPPPQELAGMPLRVEYISILAQAQKSLQVGSIQQVLQFAAGAATAFPQVLDKIDIDEAIDQFATDLGAPPSIIVSDDKVKAIRARKQQMQQQQQMAAMAPAYAQYAKAAKDASAAQATPGSLLGAAGAAINAGQQGVPQP